MSNPAKIKFGIAAFLFFIFCSPAALAQCNYTTVSATITDPNGVSYSSAQISADLVPAPPGNPICGGIAFSGHIGPITASSTGAFSMQVPPNESITPSSTQWKFTVLMAPGVPLPFGTGPQSFAVNVTVSGSTQSITSALNTAAPALTLPFGGTGTNILPLSNTFTGSVNTFTQTVGVATLGVTGNQTVGGGITVGGALTITPLGSNACVPLLANSAGVVGQGDLAMFDATCFPGSDPGAKINACNTAAAAVQGICDARGFTGTQAFTTGVIFGTNLGAHGLTLLPSGAHWNFTLTGGTACMFDEFPDWAVISQSAQNSFTIANVSAAGGAACGVRNHALGLSGGDYFDMEGVESAQGSSANSYALGIAWWTQGGQDNSRLINDLSIDASATDSYNWLLSGNTGTGSPCCSLLFEAWGANSFGTGPVPFAIIGSYNGTGFEPNGITLHNTSLTHPKAGLPNFLCQEQGAGRLVTFAATGSFYMESTTSADVGTEEIQIDGCAVASFGTIDAKANQSSGSRTGPVINITSLYNSSVSVQNVSAINGGGAWQFPLTGAITNNFSGDAVTFLANGVGYSYDSTNRNVENLHILNSIRTDNYMRFYPNYTDTANTQISGTDPGGAGAAVLQISPGPTTGQQAGVDFFRSTSTTGNVSVVGYAGDGTGTIDWQMTRDLFSFLKGDGVGDFSIGSTNDCGNPICLGLGGAQVTINTLGQITSPQAMKAPAFSLTNVYISATNPAINTGWGVGAAVIPNGQGTAVFKVNVGTGGTASSGTLTMPSAHTDWVCQVNDINAAASNAAYNTVQTVGGSTGITVQNQTKSTGAAVAWSSGDILTFTCGAE